MNKRLLSIVFCGLLAVPAFAAKSLEVDMVDNKLSIDADTVPLSRLLRLVDTATGMKSKVPPELANRNISVKFSGLSLEDGVRKIFEGQPLDYVFIAGRGVTVTSASQTLTGTETVATYPSTPGQPEPPIQPFQQNPAPIPGQPAIPGQPVVTPAQPGFPGQQPGFPGQQVQPATIQTPFGAVSNPRAGQPVQPGSPLTTPGQQNTLFPNSQPFQQTAPATNAQQSPFGNSNTFGAGTQPQNNLNNSNPFGNSNPFPGNP